MTGAKNISAVLRLQHVKVGDTVTRYLAGELRHMLTVTDVTSDKIICVDWEFDRATGAEIDDVLDWGPPPKTTGSYIVKEDS
jgi:hypothetical protein